MGGGVGLSMYGKYRVATQNTKFAMPESAIGFFPDVGASYFLSKLNRGVGLFLSLTGFAINARDVMDLGLATHYSDADNIEEIKKNYIQTGNIENTNQYPKLDSINIKYSGSGDDGEVEDIEFYDKKGKIINISSDDFIYKHIEHVGWWITQDVAPGFHNNEGGQGEIDIKKDHEDLGQWKCTCDHENNTIQVESVEVEMF